VVEIKETEEKGSGEDRSRYRNGRKMKINEDRRAEK
jgi:hypothetical protein